MSSFVSIVASRSFLSGSFQADRSCLHCCSVLPSTSFFNLNPWSFTTDADVQDFLLAMALAGLMRCMPCNVQVALAPSSLWMVICATFTQHRPPLPADKHLRTKALDSYVSTTLCSTWVAVRQLQRNTRRLKRAALAAYGPCMGCLPPSHDTSSNFLVPHYHATTSTMLASSHRSCSRKRSSSCE